MIDLLTNLQLTLLLADKRLAMKYKLLIINESDLTKELESQDRNGFVPIKFLEKILPDAYSDKVGWKVLLEQLKEPISKSNLTVQDKAAIINEYIKVTKDNKTK